MCVLFLLVRKFFYKVRDRLGSYYQRLDNVTMIKMFVYRTQRTICGHSWTTDLISTDNVTILSLIDRPVNFDACMQTLFIQL
jgi:hypothetical protein